MTYTVQLKMSRADLQNDFRIEPQEVETEAPLTLRLLNMIENKLNQELHNKECFSVTVVLELNQTTVIDKLHIDKRTQATIKQVLDFSDNELLEEPISFGKV